MLIDITNSKDQEIDFFTLSTGHKQIIDTPTHIGNTFLSCIDMIFCIYKYVISKHGVLKNATMILFMVRLKYVHFPPTKTGITTRQISKVFKKHACF